MAKLDKTYRQILYAILNTGFTYRDASRADIAMLQIPTFEFRHNVLEDGFPLLTTKKMYYNSIIHELIWMLSGSTNIDYLKKNKVKIWDKDANNFSGGSEVGRIYGAQWRSWKGDDGPIDQLLNVIQAMRDGELLCRRLLVNAWNPDEVSADKVALPPCHWSFEIIPCKHKNDLGFMLKWNQRSTDAFLGLPFDIASYGFLGKVIEALTGIPFLKLCGNLSNVHLYGPHISLARNQITRNCNYKPCIVSVQGLHANSAIISSLDELTLSKFDVFDYSAHPAIRAMMYAKKTA